MALEIRIPHLDTYNFGVGADRLSGIAMGQAVVPTVSSPQQAGGGTSTFEVARVSTTHDLQQKLGIDVGASAGCASFGAGVSARFSFAQESAVHSASLFLSISATVHLADLSIPDCKLTDAAAALVDRPDVFGGRYGDMFLRACRRGGLFVGLLRIETTDSSQSQRIESELRGSYGLFSASAQQKFEQVTRDSNASLYCSVYQEGGPAIQLADPNDPKQLLILAGNWLKAMYDSPEKNAVPYQWTLAPLSIANGPLPPNVVDLEHAQDVIKFCATERSQLLDQLNLYTWWARHADRYDWVDGATLAEVTAAGTAVQKDLDLVAECAGAALDHPAAAVFPTSFASGRGVGYPSQAVPPTPPGAKLGTPEPKEPVQVPVWRSEQVAVQGIDDQDGAHTPSASELNLFLSVVYRAPTSDDEFPSNERPDPSNYGLVMQSVPPAGSLVMPGSTVTLACYDGS